MQGRGMNVVSRPGVQGSLIGALLSLPSDLETTFLGPVGWHSITAGQKRQPGSRLPMTSPEQERNSQSASLYFPKQKFREDEGLG